MPNLNYDFLDLQGLSHFKEKTQDKMQFSTMPSASANYLNKIVQYIGTTGTYTNGTFYKCVSNGEEPPTYTWEPIPYGTEVNASISGNTLTFTFGSPS